MGCCGSKDYDALEVRRQHQRDGNRPSGYYYRLDRIDVARGGDGYSASAPPAVVALKSRVAIGTAVVEEHIEAAPDREAFEKGLKEGVSVRAAIEGHEEDLSVWRAAVVTNGPDSDGELKIRWDDDDQEGKTPGDSSYFKPSQLAPRFGALRRDHVSSLRITSTGVVGDGTLHEALKGADGCWSVPEVLLRSPVATTIDFTVGA